MADRAWQCESAKYALYSLRVANPSMLELRVRSRRSTQDAQKILQQPELSNGIETFIKLDIENAR